MGDQEADCFVRPMAATRGRTSRALGLPSSLLGKLGVAISPTGVGRVWILVEASDEQTGLYRSDEDGARWTVISSNRDLMHRP